MSRLNLLNKQLDYDLTRQKDDDNEKTVQLNLLKDYAATLTAAANDPDFSEKLPMPPAGLYGQYHTQAVQSHSAYMKSRQDDLDYKRHVKSVENENDLLDNWGLPLNWQTSTKIMKIVLRIILNSKMRHHDHVNLQMMKTGVII